MIRDVIALVVVLALAVLFGWLAKRAWGSKRGILKWPALVVSSLFTSIFALVFVVTAIAVYELYSPPTTSTTKTPTVWLCRPGMSDNPCEADQTATVVRPNGTTSLQAAIPAKVPPIDCFYVYGAVSQQLAINADLTIGPEEKEVAIIQASRFSQVCKVYAPMYREITGLAEMIPGTYSPQSQAAATANASLLSAWNDYLTHDNQGRGVVLIGHSEGASVLIDLIKSQVDPNPSVRRLLVSVFILGGNVLVPVGKDVGGSFTNIPACRNAEQTGCVVAYSMFETPPPANAYFGYVRPAQLVPWQSISQAQAANLQVLCTNPASLAGGSGALNPYFTTTLSGGDLFRPIIAPVASPPSPWVNYPDLYTAQCMNSNGASWLQTNDIAGPGDHRWVVHASSSQTGLHIYDLNLALGNLVTLVAEEAVAYTR
jgi:hypothetical protein